MRTVRAGSLGTQTVVKTKQIWDGIQVMRHCLSVL